VRSGDRAVEWGALIALLAAMTAVAVSVVSWNDFMYGVGPVFADRGALYRDIPFTQAPGSFWVLSWIAAAVGPAAFYATARVFSGLLSAGCLFLVYDLVRRLADPRSARLALLFVLTSSYFPSVASEIGNYSLTLFLLLLCTRLALLGRDSALEWAGIGACLGFSVATKLTQSVFVVAFGLWLLWRHGWSAPRLLAFAASGLLAGLPLYYHLASDFEATWFFNVDFHLLVHGVRGLDRTRSLVQMSGFTLEMVSRSLAPLAVAIAALVLSRRGSAPPGLRPLAALTGVAYAVAVSPGILFDQYLAPVTCLLAATAGVGAPAVVRGLPVLRGWDASRRWRALWVVGLLGGLPYLVEIVDDRVPPMLQGRVMWLQVGRIDRAVEDLASRELEPGACPMTALSLTSLPLLGGPFEPAVFGAGSIFVAQLDSSMPDGAYDSMRVHTSLGGELERHPPTLVLAGFYDRERAERELVAEVAAAGYRPFPVGHFGRRPMTAWVRPECLRGR